MNCKIEEAAKDSMAAKAATFQQWGNENDKEKLNPTWTQINWSGWAGF
jgi:hypothetical protein